MKFENTEVFNFEGAIRGMRNPKESWNKSDSALCREKFSIVDMCDECDRPAKDCHRTIIGENDLELMQRLIRAGSEHRKFMRQIFVSVDITAPLFWWKEFDTYKVGTVSNSCSTMHKLAATPITLDCFEMDDLDSEVYVVHGHGSEKVDQLWDRIIWILEELRKAYNETKDKAIWKELIRLLPESWLQKRTVTMNYENLLAMCSKGQRRFHKLIEWNTAFIQWARNLPYAQELIFLDELEEMKMMMAKEVIDKLRKFYEKGWKSRGVIGVICGEFFIDGVKHFALYNINTEKNFWISEKAFNDFYELEQKDGK